MQSEGSVGEQILCCGNPIRRRVCAPVSLLKKENFDIMSSYTYFGAY